MSASFLTPEQTQPQLQSQRPVKTPQRQRKVPTRQVKIQNSKTSVYLFHKDLPNELKALIEIAHILRVVVSKRPCPVLPVSVVGVLFTRCWRHLGQRPVREAHALLLHVLLVDATSGAFQGLLDDRWSSPVILKAKPPGCRYLETFGRSIGFRFTSPMCTIIGVYLPRACYLKGDSFSGGFHISVAAIRR